MTQALAPATKQPQWLLDLEELEARCLIRQAGDGYVLTEAGREMWSLFASLQMYQMMRSCLPVKFGIHVMPR